VRPKNAQAKHQAAVSNASGFFHAHPMLIDDFRTSTWRRLTKHLQTRLQELRELNDSSANSADKTALIRGQISEVKGLLALSPESARDNDLRLVPEVDPPLDGTH